MLSQRSKLHVQQAARISLSQRTKQVEARGADVGSVDLYSSVLCPGTSRVVIPAADCLLSALQLVTLEREKAALECDVGTLQEQLKREWAARQDNDAKAAAGENAGRQSALDTLALMDALEQVMHSLG